MKIEKLIGKEDSNNLINFFLEITLDNKDRNERYPFDWVCPSLWVTFDIVKKNLNYIALCDEDFPTEYYFRDLKDHNISIEDANEIIKYINENVLILK